MMNFNETTENATATQMLASVKELTAKNLVLKMNRDHLSDVYALTETRLAETSAELATLKAEATEMAVRGLQQAIQLSGALAENEALKAKVAELEGQLAGKESQELVKLREFASTVKDEVAQFGRTTRSWTIIEEAVETLDPEAVIA